jgi:Xaa-Pro dipeptidase
MVRAFPEAEHRARIDNARRALREAGLAGAICVAPEHLYYFGGYDAHTQFSEQALIISADDADEPTYVLRDADTGSAIETSWLKDIRYYHFGAHRSESAAPLVADVLREKGLYGKALAIEFEAYALTGGYLRRLEQALGDTKLVDGTRLLGWLRVMKSPAELVYVREAQKHNLAGVNAAHDALRPGITEIQWAAAMEAGLRGSGSDYPAMPTWAWSGERTCAGHAMPTDRVIQPNEPAMFSFSGVSRRYHVSTYQSVHLGPPSKRFTDLYAAAQASQTALVAAIRPGATVASAARAAAKVLEEQGASKYMYVRWGYGVGIGYPPSWLEPLDIVQDSPDTFQPNMVFCLHVALALPEEGFGLISGGDYLLNADGIEALDTTGGSPERRELRVVE